MTCDDNKNTMYTSVDMGLNTLNAETFSKEAERQKEFEINVERYKIIVEQTGIGIVDWVRNEDVSNNDNVESKDFLSHGSIFLSPRLSHALGLNVLDNDIMHQIMQNKIIHKDDERTFRYFLKNSVSRPYSEISCRLKKGERYLWYKISLTSLFDKNGKLERVIGTFLDIDQETRTKNELSLSNIRYKTVLEQTQTVEFEYNPLTKVSYVSPLLTSKFGSGIENIDLRRGLSPYLNIHPDDKALVDKIGFEAAINQNGRYSITCRIFDRTGRDVWCLVTIDFLRNSDGKLHSVLGTLRDVDRETRAYQRLKSKVENDALTGILNQDSFYHEADKLLHSHKGGEGYAMIMMDIDKFKVINDVYGMDGGNQALVLISQVLKKMISNEDLCARMYADVFCMLIYCKKDADVVRLLLRVISGLSVKKFDYMLVPSFGVCRVSDGETSAVALCERAGFAHKSIKDNALSHWAFYDETVRHKAIMEKQIESEMENALSEKQFVVYLQPKYDIGTHKVIGAEALVRWQHPQRGLISPGLFIPLFESNGFIIKLDAYIWESVCQVLSGWIKAEKKPVPVSVNVSRLHIHNPNFKDTIIGLVEQYGLDRGLFELELTENLFFDNLDSLFNVLTELQEAGFTLAMDDFGSGYSSLNMLKNVPIDVLKIDCEFLNETVATQRGKTVIKHTVAMADELDIAVVAEGVETYEQAQFLLQCGCHIAQGFYFSRPVPIAEFERQAFGTAT